MTQNDRESYIKKQKSFENVEVTSYKKEPSSYKIVHKEGAMQNTIKSSEQGRFPANVILTYDQITFDEVCGGFPSSTKRPTMKNLGYEDGVGSASRYFYCAKASEKDRDEGLDKFKTKQCVGGGGGIGNYINDVNSCSGKFGSEKAPHKNIHPTVKPTELMQYLVRLVSPKGATILDPFMGSGSTGKAIMYENKEKTANYKFIGIEITEEYLPIANARIAFLED